MVDEKYLRVLCCPVCKTALIEQDNHLICQECRRHYPIVEGIPVLLESQASKKE